MQCSKECVKIVLNNMSSYPYKDRYFHYLPGERPPICLDITLAVFDDKMWIARFFFQITIINEYRRSQQKRVSTATNRLEQARPR